MARILVSGATGLLGRRLVADRQAAGDLVVALTRPGSKAGELPRIVWDPIASELDPALVSGFDAVLHLAGEPLADARWTAAKKLRIKESRITGTAKLAIALRASAQPPAVFVCASGINAYGDCGDQVVDEYNSFGNGFLPDVCRDWEAACAPLADVTRVVPLRIGVVLAGEGGTLRSMLPLFRLGLGGPVAGGEAYVSWVSLRDFARAVDYVLASPELRGPVNVVSPQPVTGKAFAAALGHAVHRPAVLPVPGWLVRLLFGEMAVETVLSSVRAVPRRLLESGFRFQDARLGEALLNSGVR